jgi:hypothetical protein
MQFPSSPGKQIQLDKKVLGIVVPSFLDEKVSSSLDLEVPSPPGVQL